MSLRVVGGLAYAASPVFAIMALLTLPDGHSAAHASPLSGMPTMYLLMSAFHSAPWLKLVRGRTCAGAGPGVSPPLAPGPLRR